MFNYAKVTRGNSNSRARYSRLGLALTSFLIAVLSLMSRGAVAQDKFVGSGVESRTILTFKVSPAAVRELLPPGWEPAPPTSGPSADSNLQVVFVDQQLAETAAGKPLPPVRYVLFEIPAKKKGGTDGGLMLFGGLSPGGAGPYGTNAKAVERVEREIQYVQSDSTVAESWAFKGEDGSAVSMRAQFTRGPLSRDRMETRTYSGVKVGFFRIYRYEQGFDVVQSADGSVNRLQGFTFKATGGKFGALFDGHEQLVSVTSVPWYSREIYLPGN